MTRRLVCGTLLALVACGGEDPPGPPTALENLSGASLTGTVGQQLMTPLRVRVTDADGRGVPGIAVNFTAAAGSGQITQVPTTTSSMASLSVVALVDSTDENGEAEALWTLGTVAGDQQASVTVTGVGVVTIAAVAMPDVPALLGFADNSAFIGVAGQEADGPIVAAVADQFDNPVGGVAVAFAVATGGGSVVTANGTTDAGGFVSTEVNLGPGAGLHLFTVTSAGLAPDTIAVISVTGVADPSGDELPSGDPAFVSHDARFVGVAIFESTVALHLRFGQTVVSANRNQTQPSSAVSGELDFDLDQDEATGIWPARRCIEGEDLQGFGQDAFVILDPRSLDPQMFTQGEVPVIRIDAVDQTGDLCSFASITASEGVATVPIFRNNTVTIFFPVDLLAGSQVFDFAGVITSAGTNNATDFVPDVDATTFDITAAPATVAGERPLPGGATRHSALEHHGLQGQFRRLEHAEIVRRR